MPRRLILSATERDTLLALPESQDDLIRYYTFNDSDLSLIRQRRGDANRLGFAVQLCLLRYPGYALGTDSELPEPVILWVAKQVQAEPASWAKYGERDVTRREHAQELRTYLQLAPFGLSDFRALVRELTELAQQTDKGLLLAGQALESLRQKRRILPALSVIDRACSEAIARANRRVYRALVEPLTDSHRAKLDELLKLKAVQTLREMNADNLRKVPADAPTAFIKPRWKPLVITPEGLDRKFYEICALSELKNALRSGDIWVKGSRQFRDFDDYLLPAEKFAALKREQALPLAINPNSDQYLEERLQLLDEQLATVTRLAKDNELPDAILTESGLKITPLDAAVPDRAQALIDQTSQLLPRIKITELLMDVDDWTGFSRHFTHLKDGAEAKDRTLLLSAILGDAINLGLTKMAESSPGLTYAKLSWLQAWHIRDETYSAALAELVNHQYRHAFAAHWGDGTTSSSDGQRFRAGGRGESTGHVNPKYGSEPGRLFYTHISDQYAPFSTRVVNVGVRDSTYVLDGLLYHESDLRIEEHYTDTAGFTDHVFALMHLLGFRFAPRIRDLGETKLYVPQGVQAYPTLRPLIGGTLNIKHVRAHWDDILRLASSIKQGTVTASLMLRKLGSYPRQNGLAVALRELGRIERTLFILDWLQSVELRRRVHAGLNKGEARNSLARAVFFNRLGEIRDRSFEQQRYRASGLNLVTAAIVLWNTVYLERATQGLVEAGKPVDGELLQFLSPLGWEHINLTGDYVWRQSRRLEDGKFRPLRMPGKP